MARRAGQQAKALNDFIRTSGTFDGVIDFDNVRSATGGLKPDRPRQHHRRAGASSPQPHRLAMGQAIDLGERGWVSLRSTHPTVKSLYLCLGRDQLPAVRGPDRQPYLFAAAAGGNRRGNAISVFRVGVHGVIEQYRIAAFQHDAQRRGRFDAEELKDFTLDASAERLTRMFSFACVTLLMPTVGL